MSVTKHWHADVSRLGLDSAVWNGLGRVPVSYNSFSCWDEWLNESTVLPQQITLTTKTSSLDRPVMKLIEEFVKVQSQKIEKRCQNLLYPTRFPWTSYGAPHTEHKIDTSSPIVMQNFSFWTRSGMEKSVNTDWTFVLSVLRLWKMHENYPAPVSITQSTISESSFCFFIVCVFF